ncbi:SDR family NAD(P)-dependent oxidoreductase [Ottowia thiooxydans]|uniref:SDR family NAD(P)-dependent oxidoreductase n=1 Tax=Ottowia thiooxydans TaxID=219182 RepID=UPI000421D073|nr:SDR family NAD(P)-dependent oxidoreductase [Ottowia thiooxydans]
MDSIGTFGKRLTGRKILVTGAASGIGRATAELFAQQGASLALLDLDAQGLATVGAITGGHVFGVDVTDEEAVAHVIHDAATAMGGIDGIVNCVGVQMNGTIEDTSVATWRRVMEINVTGMYIVVRCCLPWLRQHRHSTIVNTGSGQSLLPNIPQRTSYAASKGAVLNFTRALAAELAPDIRANTICPGLVDTPMVPNASNYGGNYALKRVAQPEEIAQAMLFLTSTESSYVTGAALAVDGGRSFH